jgi:hypothetical protein
MSAKAAVSDNIRVAVWYVTCVLNEDTIPADGRALDLSEGFSTNR